MADVQIANNIPSATAAHPQVNNSIRKVDNVTMPSKVQFKQILLDGGLSVGSTSGAYAQPVMYRKFSAGERIRKIDIRDQFRILAPKVPTVDKLDAVVRVMFVPMTYIVDNYDTMKAFKDDAGVINNDVLPVAVNTGRPTSSIYGQYSESYAWKQKVASFFTCNSLGSDVTVDLSIVRAYFACRDSFLRVKNYQPKLARYTQQVPTQQEIDEVLGTFDVNGQPILNGLYGDIQRDVMRSDYYTNLRPRVQSVNGQTGNSPFNFGTQFINAGNPYNTGNNGVVQGRLLNTMLTVPTPPTAGATPNSQGLINMNQVGHIDWQTEIAEFRRRQNDSVLNDWDIVAALGSTVPVRTDRPEYLGERQVALNYQQITATANSSDANLGNAPLGTPGAYSLTEDSGELQLYREFQQDGVMIITTTITTPMVPEQGIHRTALMTNARDFYNPNLATFQLDKVLPSEIDGTIPYIATANFGFKPKYTEHDTLPNLCIRDCRSIPLKTQGSTSTVPLYIASLNFWHSMLQKPSLRSDGSTVGTTADGFYFADKTDLILARNSRLNYTGVVSNDLCLFAMKFDFFIERPVVPVNEKFGSDKPGSAV